MAYRRYKPSRAAAAAFRDTMQEIEAFCAENGISHSASCDSYYFTVNGRDYRVSNHSIEASNRAAYHPIYGQIRDTYHDDKRDPDTTYIHASKTRIIEIYNDLKAGYELDGRGNRKG